MCDYTETIIIEEAVGACFSEFELSLDTAGLPSLFTYELGIDPITEVIDLSDFVSTMMDQ